MNANPPKNLEIFEIARRAVACRHWRWMPGMLAQPTRLRVTETTGIGSGDYLPDLEDPATIGCLLALVREAWAWPHAFACHDETGWCVPSGQIFCCVELQDEAGDGERYETESEALVAALEAVP